MLETIIEFFTSPYINSSTLDIVLEIVAATMGVASVYLAKQENILVYPIGIISTGIYIYLLFKFTLFGDMIVNGYYTIMSAYGWYIWKRAGDSKELTVTTTSARDKRVAAFIFFSTAFFVLVVYLMNERFDRWTDYVDTFTTGVFFMAMYLMAHKKLESWIFWIIGNIISVPLYFYKGLGFTAVQYIIFLVLAFMGYQAWKISYNNNRMTA